MDPALKDAVRKGDVKFLNKAVAAVKPPGYFLTQSDDGMGNFLHLAAFKGDVEFLKQAMNIMPKHILKQLLSQSTDDGKLTMLHIAAMRSDIKLVKCIKEMYMSLPWDHSDYVKPWLALNLNCNDTALNLAVGMPRADEKCTMEILLMDPQLESCTIADDLGSAPLYSAVEKGFNLVAEKILMSQLPLTSLVCSTIELSSLFGLTNKCSEKTGRMLLEKYWWMINMRDDQGKTALDYAKQANALWLVNLLTKPSLLHKEDFDWIEACKREENLAVFAFVETCDDLERACRLKNDTPLHHIKLPTYKDYLKFLKNPSITELKNITDHDGATALHRALERKDIGVYFCKALLLDDEVKKTIADYNGTTAMDLLSELCKENDEWDKMCKLINVNPDLKTSYIQAGANLDKIRSTLSVVAALLAAITFAAGFTLPGGLNSDTGEALLAKKASFLVFLLADVYAMCTSMLVLFCLIWSMVSESDMARLLVDRSVFLLMQSLYGTLLAFMTGVYAVIEQNSLWAAMIIFVMCSIIGVSANRTILHKVISKLVPAANRDKQQDRLRLLEEGSAGTS